MCALLRTKNGVSFRDANFARSFRLRFEIPKVARLRAVVLRFYRVIHHPYREKGSAWGTMHWRRQIFFARYKRHRKSLFSKNLFSLSVSLSFSEDLRIFCLFILEKYYLWVFHTLIYNGIFVSRQNCVFYPQNNINKNYDLHKFGFIQSILRSILLFD